MNPPTQYLNITAQIAALLLGLLGGGLLLLGLGLLPYWQSLDPVDFTQLFSGNVPLIGAAMKPLGFSATGITWLAMALAVWKKLPTRNWLIIASVGSSPGEIKPKYRNIAIIKSMTLG